MATSQKLAIAAHLHVLLRRKTGRVTDTEWMAENLDYALEVVRFARAKADEDQHPDLHEWADKLECAMLDKTAPPPKPLVQSALQALRQPAAPARAGVTERTSGFAASRFGASTGFSESNLEADRAARREAAAPRYVGGIR